jgi:hypothetical protein
VKFLSPNISHVYSAAQQSKLIKFRENSFLSLSLLYNFVLSEWYLSVLELLSLSCLLCITFCTPSFVSEYSPGRLRVWM